MEADQLDATAVRRRRRVERPVREQTPDPNARRKSSEDESTLIDVTATSKDATAGAQLVRMQIRPPGTISAHESKILRRRDKAFANAAARSLSQPRKAERLSNPEVSELLGTVKRSLSSPRRKDSESSEGDFHATSNRGNLFLLSPANDTKLSRLEQNLQRFEEERRRFEEEKRSFEREKLHHRQILDNEERRRLLQNYRKLSDHTPLPQEVEERRRLVHSLRLKRSEAPTVATQTTRLRHRRSDFATSSKQFSSSEADTAEELATQQLQKQLSPVRRHASALATASVRGPPPEPPQNGSIGRTNSLSPIRPQRRSKTPDQRAQREGDTGQLSKQGATASGLTTEKEKFLGRAKLNVNDSETQTEHRRRQSFESVDRRDGGVGEASTPPPMPAFPKVLAKASEGATGSRRLKIFESFKQLSFVRKLTEFFENRSKSKPLKAPQHQTKLLPPQPVEEVQHKILSKAFVGAFCAEARYQWRHLKADYPHELVLMRNLRNNCIAHSVMLVMLCGFGGLMFRYTEGTAENIYKCEVRKVKRDFIDSLWTVSHNMREDDWKSLARQKLRKFEEELHVMRELGLHYFPGQKSWNFVNCILYCWTVITTIGYGHITPNTTLGQSLTIIYAILGIPIFLILLADFGKLFTRCMKFLWAYVRRLYYTGTCRKIRKQQQVRDAMTGFTTVYDMAIRRPSHFFGISGGGNTDVESQPSVGASHPETPTSPYPETFEVDDEFNLPISLASLLLISYILIGAFVYTLWEDWTYFEAFYFVFISMSTIGFGDFVPNHPIFMMCSIIYLVFGLALTSMFINVVQIKLNDTFKQASTKIRATIGLGLPSELGDETGSQLKTPSSELASVHGSRLDRIAETERESSTTSPSAGSPALPTVPSVVPSADKSHESSDPAPPPLLPRRQVSNESQPPQTDKQKKKRFFK